MFIGGLPDGILAQLVKSVDFSAWKSVYVLCSGSFRIERVLRRYHPLLEIHSNDVSLLTCAVGHLARGEDMPMRFHGELAWIEERLGEEAKLADRVSALLVAGQMTRFSGGKMNLYKTKHVEHIKANFDHLLGTARTKLDKLLEGVIIDSFFPGDFRRQIERAREAGGGVIGFPPTYKGGYENLYKFLHANIDWPEPSYDIFDPASLSDIVDGVAASGLPWCIGADQILRGREPIIEFVPGRNRPLYAFSDSAKASYRIKDAVRSDPFKFVPLDMSKVSGRSQVKLVEIDSAKASYVKDIYLAKHIIHSPGMANFAVLLDGMLAGLIIYTRSTHQAYHPEEIYLLSDLSTSRDAKLSKLIARLSLSRTVLRVLEKRMIRRISFVVTTAFSKNPVSMKYRGVFDLLKRMPNENGGYSLNYGHAVIDDTPEAILQWWWKKYGKGAGAQPKQHDPDRNPIGRSEIAQVTG